MTQEQTRRFVFPYKTTDGQQGIGYQDVPHDMTDDDAWELVRASHPLLQQETEL